MTENSKENVHTKVRILPIQRFDPSQFVLDLNLVLDLGLKYVLDLRKNSEHISRGSTT